MKILEPFPDPLFQPERTGLERKDEGFSCGDVGDAAVIGIR